MENGDNVLIDALPSIGKSSNVIPAARETDSPVTILTARHDLYDQYEEWCKDYQKEYNDNFEFQILPSFLNDCPTACGDEGDGWQQQVKRIYDRGVSGRDIHNHANRFFGEPLPCTENNECPYDETRNFDADVLIGHYTYAYVHPAVNGRVVVFDEFPEDDFVTDFDNPSVAVSDFLKSSTNIPFNDFTDLITNRLDPSYRDAALKVLNDIPIGQLDNPSAVLDDPTGQTHALAPHIVFTLVNSEQIDGKWECSTLGHEAGVYNRESGKVRVLRPPRLTDARNVIGLDGTPSWRMWNIVLGCGLGANEMLEHKQILTDDERREYVRDVLSLTVIRTTSDAKHYSGGKYVDPEKEKALIEAVCSKHRDSPALITTKKAVVKYKKVGALNELAYYDHYGNIKGSNKYGQSRVGIVIGSQVYGYDYVEEWASFLGEQTDSNGKGMNLSFSEFGDEVLHHMRELEVTQAIMRFGRDTNGATVYVHTAAIPDWMPISAKGRVSDRGRGYGQVVRALSEIQRASTDDIAAHSEVKIKNRQVGRVLDKLEEEGHVTYEKSGRKGVWVDRSLDTVNPSFDVSLPS
ncbi:hypothetical protein DV706_08475 [Natronorubrum bangense]|uniref:Uncharacterized protein n=3 Tax=Natronorubrum bangense TaxID=61858 RepID=L9WPF8_9EURY|nr:hypothetical protein C494_04356 [Natronorubrum bangense JCM 10635]QCC54506.1 hypothetical protein DV706_08475 [Natronorubrum bangense]